MVSHENSYLNFKIINKYFKIVTQQLVKENFLNCNAKFDPPREKKCY